MQQGLKGIYHKIAKRYELSNHLLTFGLDYLWRRKAVSAALRGLKNGSDTKILDMCSGTGETANSLASNVNSGTKIYAADYSDDMLNVARTKKNAHMIEFVRADANLLPFPDNYFDLITITFALRNLHPTKDAFIQCIDEFRRVLKPNGRLVTLETSQPKYSIVRSFFHAYVKALVYPVGKLATANSEGFRYLAGSILKFYSAEELKDVILNAGFSSVDFKRMTFGAVALHVSKK